MASGTGGITEPTKSTDAIADIASLILGKRGKFQS